MDHNYISTKNIVHCTAFLHVYILLPPKYSRAKMERIEESRTADVSLPVTLVVIAGILIIAGAAISLAILLWSQSMLFDMGSSMMMGGGWQMFVPAYVPPLIATMAAISLASGGAVLVAAYKMKKEPDKVQKWGSVVLTASIVTLFCIGGTGLGSILGIIGGVLAISRRSAA